jgi:hypothetical protein
MVDDKTKGLASTRFPGSEAKPLEKIAHAIIPFS